MTNDITSINGQGVSSLRMVNQILTGDALTMLKTLPDGIVQTCVTSPPYFGLRDYQTETILQLEGDPQDCQHVWIHEGRNEDGAKVAQCQQCFAVKVDRQIGLEETPEAYVAKLVEVFREVRRVLRDDGTCWINLGDTYANDTKWGGSTGGKHVQELHGDNPTRHRRHTGLKPKDLIGIPWMVAFALRTDGWYLRSDIIWNKPTAMPESVTDRPTKAHEYLFLLAKSERYYYDADAIREPLRPKTFTTYGTKHHAQGNDALGKVKSDNWGRTVEERQPRLSADGEIAGANKRTIWTVASQPFSGAVLLADYVGNDGKPYKVSEDCPIHGRSRGTHILKTGGYDVQQDHVSSHKSDRSSHHDQEHEDVSSAIPSHESQDLEIASVHGQSRESTHDYRSAEFFDKRIPQTDHGTAHTQETPVYNSGSQYPLCSETAIDHNKQSHKTDLVPGTNLAYTPFVETPCRTDDMSDLPLWCGQDGYNGGNNTEQGDLNGHPSERTGRRNAGKSSDQSTFLAYVHGNTAKCTCQVVSIDHFATFPPKLIEPCILAGTSPRACEHCLAPWERAIEPTGHINKREPSHTPYNTPTKVDSTGWAPTRLATDNFQPTCTCPNNTGSGKCVVLDPFCGAGTTPLVASQFGRDWLGIELNPAYVTLAMKRIETIQPVLWEVTA